MLHYNTRYLYMALHTHSSAIMAMRPVSCVSLASVVSNPGPYCVYICIWLPPFTQPACWQLLREFILRKLYMPTKNSYNRKTWCSIYMCFKDHFGHSEPNFNTPVLRALYLKNYKHAPRTTTCARRKADIERRMRLRCRLQNAHPESSWGAWLHSQGPVL